MQQQMLAYKRSQLNNHEFTWTSYRDCPFVSKKALLNYQAMSGGWYHAMYNLMVSIAGIATFKKYPITASEIETLIRQIDADTGSWYTDRPIRLEAERAIEFILQNSITSD